MKPTSEKQQEIAHNTAIWRQALGVRLFNLALQWASSDTLPGTQAEREAQIKTLAQRKHTVHGTRSIAKIRGHIELAAQGIVAGRRLKARHGHGLGATHGHPPARCAPRRLAQGLRA